MIYLDEWQALSSEIRGLTQAAELHARFLSVNSSDQYGRGSNLLAHCRRVVERLDKFQADFESVLPRGASDSLSDFLGTWAPHIKAQDGRKTQQTWSALVALGAFNAEMTYLLSSQEELLRSRTELAFLHLQRSLVVDVDVQRRWREAYSQREEACEKLGSVHLLSHGIWAFKVGAAGGQTDLIFPEPPQALQVQQSGSGLVLTEWKKADANSAEKAFRHARQQAMNYVRGPLAALELSHCRYLVVVTLKPIKTPDDEKIDGIVYRSLNVAIDYGHISAVARKQAK